MFKELSKEKVNLTEEKQMDDFLERNILNKSIDKGNDYFVFYDGPATANGMPGIHHMLAKLLKDSFCKYKTMQGYKVLRKVGWDTHGLPVEVQVEKELGFSGKTDIEKYGIEAFNKKCRESVWKNESAFKDFTNKMGQFIDLKNPYITYDNNYIETEWWILKKFFDEGLIYDGLKILPYCTRCGTGLATHEVAQGYKEITVNTVTVPFKLKTIENTYLLVWTTTPWTLLANVAACVNPNEEYVKCSFKEHNYIVAKSLASKVFNEEYTVLETFKGSSLEGLEYEQFLPVLSVNKKAFYVTLADYVTMEDGTGIVHIAPAFGQDDYEVGLKYDLPILNPVDEQGKYTDGPFKGRLVVDSELEIDIIKYLASLDKIFKKQKMEHNYPHCWRCKTPLLYYSKPSLYIKVTDFKDKIIAANSEVNWHPSFVGEKRFSNWLENMNDWAISRNRYWGTPIPLWKCSCGHSHMIGSISELVEEAIEDIDQSIELHRPYVDNIHIRCSKCGKEMTRIKEVMDCWFDSGSMPFAQYHYPFENQDLFSKQFPADFISEGIDQTRGWFYSLLVISTFVMGKAPYKNVLVNDLLLDKFGQKMHKSKGNAIEPFSVIEKYGADAVRWYMVYASPVWTPLKFDEEGIKEINSKFLSTLKNTYNFFMLYANTDGIDPRTFDVDYDKRAEIDKWLLSKYNRLVNDVIKAYDNYDLTIVTRRITEFVSEDLSNWYIRRNRRRFWKSEFDIDKSSVYRTTYEVLVGVCKLSAPIAPFITDEIYCALTNEESVHLSNMPKYDESYVNLKLEEKMDLVRDLISLGRQKREDTKIKVRQPIKEVIIDKKHESKILDLVDLIKEELNVKDVIFVSDTSKYMNFTYKPNYKIAGPVFGSSIKEFANYLSNVSSDIIENMGESITITLDKDYLVTKDMIDVRIDNKEGFDVASDGNLYIILNTSLTPELLLEGIARELISKVQQMRKNNDYEVMDRINIYYSGTPYFEEVLKIYETFIKKETLCDNFIKDNSLVEEIELNSEIAKIKVEKVK